MKKLVILGSGTAGTMVANKLRDKLPKREWSIAVVDRDEVSRRGGTGPRRPVQEVADERLGVAARDQRVRPERGERHRRFSH